MERNEVDCIHDVKRNKVPPAVMIRKFGNVLDPSTRQCFSLWSFAVVVFDAVKFVHDGIYFFAPFPVNFFAGEAEHLDLFATTDARTRDVGGDVGGSSIERLLEWIKSLVSLEAMFLLDSEQVLLSRWSRDRCCSSVKVGKTRALFRKNDRGELRNTNMAQPLLF